MCAREREGERELSNGDDDVCEGVYDSHTQVLLRLETGLSGATRLKHPLSHITHLRDKHGTQSPFHTHCITLQSCTTQKLQPDGCFSRTLSIVLEDSIL